jgi:E3 ubiquitin-protein ligase SHPRH
MEVPLASAASSAQLVARRSGAGAIGLFVNDTVALTPAWSENVVKAIVILLQNEWLCARLDGVDAGHGPRQGYASLRFALVDDGTKAFNYSDERAALGKVPRSPCRRALVTVLDTLLPPPASAASTMAPGEATHDWLYRSTAAQLDRRPASAGASSSGGAVGAAVDLGAETERALERVLRPNLRPYQKRALRWMLRREHGARANGEGERTLVAVAGGSDDPSLCLWGSEGTVAPDGPHRAPLALFAQRESGRVRTESQSAPPAFEDSVRGGILADEMGLGKTVVVIALIAAHRMHAVAGSVEEVSAAADEEVSAAVLGRADCPPALSLRVRVHPQWSWGSSAARLRAERFGALAPNRVVAHILRCGDRAWLSVLRPKSDEIVCPCGVAESDDAGIWLRCVRCRCVQHAACVGKPGGLGDAPSGEAPPGAAASQPHTCMGCLSRLPPRATRATLVICPAAILSQWQDEIAKHTRPGAVNVVVYMGVRAALRGLQTHGAAKSGGLRDIDPDRLARADVVLTTFSVLRQDIHHAKPVARTVRRRGGRRQKYAHVSSPLLMLHWHRCVIDEAQMVHSESCNATAMARRLRCSLRWAVTGTPVSGSFNDLQGLLAFLGAAPFADPGVWHALIEAPLLTSAHAAPGSRAAKVRAEERARALFNRLMWRHAKVDVADELRLPPQHHHEVRIELSPIERHFYGAQEEECNAIAKQVAEQAKAAADAEAKKRRQERVAPPPHARQPPQEVQQRSATSNAGSSASTAVAVDADTSEELAEAARVREPWPSARASASTDHAETSAASGSLEENMARLLNPLLRLRQACCHPQIGAHGLRGVAGQSMKSLDVCHALMMKQQQNKAMEALRSVCASKNGLAGLLLLTGDPDALYEEGGLGQPDGTVRTTTKRKEACQLYRSVCALSDAHRGKLGKKGEKPSFAKIHGAR